MTKLVDISEYYPETVKEMKKFIKLAESENPEFNLLWKETELLLANQFISTSTEYGVLKWENILKIIPKIENTIEDRKTIILLRLFEELPYTFNVLREYLSNICGEDGYTAQVIHNKYTLIVKISLEQKEYSKEVDLLLRRIVPANIIIDFDLLYNTHRTLNMYTHKYLNIFSQKALKDEVLYDKQK